MYFKNTPSYLNHIDQMTGIVVGVELDHSDLKGLPVHVWVESFKFGVTKT